MKQIFSFIFTIICIFFYIYFNHKLITQNTSVVNKLLIFLGLIIINITINITINLIENIKNKNVIKIHHIIKNVIQSSLIGLLGYILFFDINQLNLISNINIKILIISIIISLSITIFNIFINLYPN